MEPSRYEWIENDGALCSAACITAVAGARPEDVLEAFDADRSVTLSVDDAYGGDDPYPASVTVLAVPDGVVAIEMNGFRGSLDEVLSRLSRLGATASIYWNVNFDNAFSCARGGEVVAMVDMIDADEPGAGADLPAELTDLFVSAGDAGEHSEWATGLAMVEAFTGVAVPEDPVTQSATFHPVAASAG